MITSVGAEKASDKIQHLLMTEILHKIRIEENLCSLIMNIYKKCAANIILNAEKLEIFLLTSGTRQERLLPPLLLNILLEVLANRTR